MLKSKSWLIVLVIVLAAATTVYAIRGIIDLSIGKQTLENQNYIIKTLNDSEEQRQQNKIAILNNITHKIDKNTFYLEQLIKTLNVTIVVHDNDITNQTDKISSFKCMNSCN